MTVLLTPNGIPPQIVATLGGAERRRLRRYTSGKNLEQHFAYSELEWGPTSTATKLPLSAAPFVSAVSTVIGCYLAWGASFAGMRRISLNARRLKPGHTLFEWDKSLHADKQKTETHLGEFYPDTLTLRMLYASNTQPLFLDFTAQENMSVIVDARRVATRPDQDAAYSRYFGKELIEDAKSVGKLIRPSGGDVVIFDAATPHAVFGVTSETHRHLLNAWIELKLPKDWRERTARGDVPKLG